MPNRGHKGDQSYRYGFNGKEKNKEWSDNYDFGDRSIYSSRLGLFNSIDPDTRKYPGMSPYSFAAGNPIYFIDYDGRGPIVPSSWWQGNGYLAGFAAGFVDAAWGNAELVQEVGKITVATQPLLTTPMGTYPNLYYFTPHAKSQREEIQLRTKALLSIARDGDKLKEVAKVMADAISEWAGDASFQNGSDKAGYAHGQLAFELVVTVVTSGGGSVKSLYKAMEEGSEALTKYLRSFKVSKSQMETLMKGGFCFVAGTQVAITNNQFKNIELVQVGDSVLVYNEEAKQVQQQIVLNVFKNKTTKLVLVQIGSEKIFSTLDHPYYVNGRWVEAHDLRAGDSLLSSSGNKLVINSVKSVDTTNVDVYNFEVNSEHNYFVSGLNILVHNTCWKERLEKFMEYATNIDVKTLVSQEKTIEHLENVFTMLDKTRTDDKVIKLVGKTNVEILEDGTKIIRQAGNTGGNYTKVFKNGGFQIYRDNKLVVNKIKL